MIAVAAVWMWSRRRYSVHGNQPTAHTREGCWSPQAVGGGLRDGSVAASGQPTVDCARDGRTAVVMSGTDAGTCSQARRGMGPVWQVWVAVPDEWEDVMGIVDGDGNSHRLAAQGCHLPSYQIPRFPDSQLRGAARPDHDLRRAGAGRRLSIPWDDGWNGCAVCLERATHWWLGDHVKNWCGSCPFAQMAHIREQRAFGRLEPRR